jgi:hypothetical protein
MMSTWSYSSFLIIASGELFHWSTGGSNASTDFSFLFVSTNLNPNNNFLFLSTHADYSKINKWISPLPMHAS